MAQNFLWHRLSEEEKEEIRKESKRIMEDFGKALEKAEKEIKEPGLVKRDRQTREETKTETDSEFRKIFLKNAPSTEKSDDGEWIKAEKGSWK